MVHDGGLSVCGSILFRNRYFIIFFPVNEPLLKNRKGVVHTKVQGQSRGKCEHKNTESDGHDAHHFLLHWIHIAHGHQTLLNYHQHRYQQGQNTRRVHFGQIFQI